VAVTTSTDLSHVRVRREPPAAYVVLDRPERRNALSLDLMRELTGVLEELGRDTAVRAIVLGGEGPAFSAGHDIDEMRGRDDAFYHELFDACVQLMQTLHLLPQPVIARVHGVATAAGCQLVASCDLAVASESARFATPGVRIGLFCSTPMVPVSRAVGRKRAMEMLLTGDFVDARTALDWGLVNRVVADDELDTAVGELVERITAASPHVLAIGKEAFWRQIDLDEPGAYELTKAVIAANAGHADAQEGFAAFLEKRRIEPGAWPSQRRA
jgi:enoyl-CoA hydratase/carnithine racemase